MSLFLSSIHRSHIVRGRGVWKKSEWGGLIVNYVTKTCKIKCQQSRKCEGLKWHGLENGSTENLFTRFTYEPLRRFFLKISLHSKRGVKKSTSNKYVNQGYDVRKAKKGNPRVNTTARMMKNDEKFDKIILPSAVIKYFLSEAGGAKYIPLQIPLRRIEISHVSDIFINCFCFPETRQASPVFLHKAKF